MLLCADALNVAIHKRNCYENKNCTVSKIDSDLSFEIKDKILRSAAVIQVSEKKRELETIKNKRGKYNLDLNSRKISNGHISLNLTEKETQIILFINLKKSVSLRELQVEVWQHSSNLETHTVETHIYRLRKKILETFKDENFIKHDKKGYYLN